jgi:predicted extracellular nuclease
MKRLLLTLGVSALATHSNAQLLITGVIDGPLSGGVPKAVELYATEDIADLSIYGIESANNGAAAQGPELFLSGSALAGEFIYAASEPNGFTQFFGFAPDFTGGALSINGDDAIILYESGANIDEFGVVGDDGTGTAWEYTDGWAYRSESPACAGSFDIDAWQFSGTNALDGESTNGAAETAFPLASFASTIECDTQDVVVTINEIHYDNVGGDEGEAVEIAATVGADLSGWSVVLYNGNGGAPYGSAEQVDLAFAGSSADTDFYVLDRGDFGVSGIQNGPPDGLALVDAGGNTVEFLSYEGTFTAVGGPANGLLSTDIGVSEDSGTAIDESLQRCGVADWRVPQLSTFGAENTCPDVLPEPIDVLISDIQGEADSSPLDGQYVRITGVVTADLEEPGEIGGFFVQEEAADEDGNPATSEGIFVFCDGVTCDVAVGDTVTVQGKVDSFSGQTQIDNDDDNLSVVVIDAPSGLGAPVAALLSYPLAPAFDLESVEGMLVTITSDMRVTEYFNFDRFGDLVLWTDGTGAERPYQASQIMDPLVVNPDDVQEKFARQSLVVDDSRGDQNVGKLFPVNDLGGPVFGDASYVPSASLDGYAGFRGGDLVTGIEGVMGEAFGSYRLYVSDPSAGTAIDGDAFDIQIVNTNPRQTAPETVGGSLKVASFNVLNYFTTLDRGRDICGPSKSLECRGADSPDELARQQEKIVAALADLDADIVGLIEIENTDGASAEATLASALNAVSGRNYAAVQTGTVGTDAIKVAFIYDTATVQLVGNFAVLEEGFLDPLDIGRDLNRAALAQTFQEATGNGIVTVAVNHFKSKGSGCGDGDDDPVQGSCNATRTAAAEALAAWLDTDPTGSGDDDVLILGDLNSYAKEDPITLLADAGYTDLAASFLGDSAYGYVFSGRWGTLDYALANAALLAQVAGVTEWHINADEPDAIDYDTGFNPQAWFAGDAFRSSDHDPVLVGLNLLGSPEIKNDCKKGGWKTFVTADGESFKNQGSCVSYVASGKGAKGKEKGGDKGKEKGKEKGGDKAKQNDKK